jgi:DNA-directed RNA polymerase specialized sigma24 family protein
MKNHSNLKWPPIASAYTDEYGQIEHEVYIAAGMIWRDAENYALRVLKDTDAGARLMFKAAATVSVKLAQPQNSIQDLTKYLFQTYKRLVLDELKKQRGHARIETESKSELVSLTVSLSEDIDRKILIEQIIQRMDPWMRNVFELRSLDHSFDEIAAHLGEKANVIRSRFSKNLANLVKMVQKETQEACDRASKRKG